MVSVVSVYTYLYIYTYTLHGLNPVRSVDDWWRKYCSAFAILWRGGSMTLFDRLRFVWLNSLDSWLSSCCFWMLFIIVTPQRCVVKAPHFLFFRVLCWFGTFFGHISSPTQPQKFNPTWKMGPNISIFLANLPVMEEIRLTSWWLVYPIIYRVLCIPSGLALGFLNHQQYVIVNKLP